MIKELLSRYPNLNSCSDAIVNTKKELIKCYQSGGKLLLCGNGGSCSDCEHIAGELMKGFLKMRPLTDEKKTQMKAACPLVEDEMLNQLQRGLPAIPLSSFTALNSAFCNDVNAELVYAQTLIALAKEQDVLFAISTSGNSQNVVNAAKVAKALGIIVISLTGGEGGKICELSDVCICVPEMETYKIQELHLPIYHYLCAEIEKYFFDL